jgi:hypothetical protein
MIDYEQIQTEMSEDTQKPNTGDNRHTAEATPGAAHETAQEEQPAEQPAGQPVGAGDLLEPFPTYDWTSFIESFNDSLKGIAQNEAGLMDNHEKWNWVFMGSNRWKRLAPNATPEADVSTLV